MAALLGGAAVKHFETLAANDIKSKLRGEHAVVTVHTAPHGLLGHLSGDLNKVTIMAKNFSTDGLPLFTEPDRSKAGKARRVDIALEDFVLAGLHVESLDASIPDCRFDFPLAKRKGKIRLSQSGTGTGSVTIDAPDLEKFILAKFHEIKRVSVHLKDGRALVEGYGEFIVVKANFSVDARLVAVDGTKLTLADTRISLDNHLATPEAADALLRTLNPIVDLDKDLHLYGTIKVDKIELENEKLTASGATKIPVLPESLREPGRQP